MPTLELTDAEAAVLRSALESYLREATSQISNTEKYELREELKKDREVIRKVCQGTLTDSISRGVCGRRKGLRAAATPFSSYARPKLPRPPRRRRDRPGS